MHILTIKDIGPDQYGTYRCTAVNDNGVHFADIIVKGKMISSSGFVLSQLGPSFLFFLRNGSQNRCERIRITKDASLFTHQPYRNQTHSLFPFAIYAVYAIFHSRGMHALTIHLRDLLKLESRIHM